MSSTTSKSILAGVVAAFALLGAGRASAQSYGGSGVVGGGAGGVSGTTPLTSANFTMTFDSVNNAGQWVEMNQTTQKYFFNQARCLCGSDPNGEFKVAIRAGAGVLQQVQTLLSPGFVNAGQGWAFLYAGASDAGCLTPINNSTGYNPALTCTNLLSPNSYPGTPHTLTEVVAPNVWPSDPIPVATLFGAYCGHAQSCASTSNCTTNTSIRVQFWAQASSSNQPDFTDVLAGAAVNLAGSVGVAPTIVQPVGVGNEALIVNWSWPSGTSLSTNGNLAGVQLFCQRGANTPVFPGKYAAHYQTASMACPNTLPPTTGTSLTSLDPIFLCSELLSPTEKDHRITVLQNGIWYGVGVAAVDKFGNISAISGPAYGMPIPTVDFYSEYRDAGGKAQGGYCTLDRWSARPGALAILCVVGLSFVLVLRRCPRKAKRSRKVPPGTGTLLLIVATSTLAASQAHAQAIYRDNSFIDDRATEVWNGTPREYAIEVRFGLYTPNVDSEISGSPKPNSFIFGTKRRPMWQLEYDWEIMQAFGTLAVGGVIGYYKENASACKRVELVDDPTTCARSGDNTSLRLIPLAALLVYRMDEGARQWKIPLVPYGKIGLNYTFWSVNDGNGNVPTYAGGGRGKGGTAGWQAAVGISLLLDFLDPGAARGFDADAGVNHSYAFFELDHIDGSGLGRKDVLRVGDNTWFTGLMFEF